MRVLVDALPARDGGGVTYLIEEIRALEAAAPQVTLDVLVSPWAYEAIGGSIESEVRCVNAKTVVDRFAFEQTVLLKRARSYDVLYCPLNFGPMLRGRSPCRAYTPQSQLLRRWAEHTRGREEQAMAEGQGVPSGGAGIRHGRGHLGLVP